MFATIARMAMRRVNITDENLEIAEQALRGLANRYRYDAKRQSNPLIIEGFEKHASDCERTAERMRRFREPSI